MPVDSTVAQEESKVGGGMYAQYRCMEASQCMSLPAEATAAEGASSFINPLTALGMVETMRREGHTALVHTAAASNLGQMLQRICHKDQIALVNIVRKPEQAELLRAQGATYVCSTSSPDFMAELTDALAATGATIAFDAIGGGKLAGQILACMEAAIARSATGYSRYGSDVLKQVYIYGGLDLSPTEITRSWPKIHHHIGRRDYITVVFDYHQGVSQIAKPHKRFQQPIVVPWVKANCWLIENIKNPGKSAPNLARKSNSLGFPAGKSGG